jgi:hypothetical protein
MNGEKQHCTSPLQPILMKQYRGSWMQVHRSKSSIDGVDVQRNVPTNMGLSVAKPSLGSEA